MDGHCCNELKQNLLWLLHLQGQHDMIEPNLFIWIQVWILPSATRVYLDRKGNWTMSSVENSFFMKSCFNAVFTELAKSHAGLGFNTFVGKITSLYFTSCEVERFGSLLYCCVLPLISLLNVQWKNLFCQYKVFVEKVSCFEIWWWFGKCFEHFTVRCILCFK